MDMTSLAAGAGSADGLAVQLFVSNASEAIGFYQRAFGAVERNREAWPSGRVLQAELVIGGSALLIADADHQRLFRPPDLEDPPSFALHLQVMDLTLAFTRAIESGARAIRVPEEQANGPRTATLVDPFGLVWILLGNSGHRSGGQLANDRVPADPRG